MTHLERRIAGLVSAAALTLSLGLFAVPAQANHDCADPKWQDHPHCSGGGGDDGGGGGKTLALAACDRFHDRANDIVTSDTPGDDYCHKEDGNVNVGERHRLDTNKLNPNGRQGTISADPLHCTQGDDGEEFTPVIGDLDITMQIRGEQTCIPEDGGCDCTDISLCSADNFDPGSTPSEMRAMAM